MFIGDKLTARAKVKIHHEEAYDFDEKTGLWRYRPVGEDEEVWNILTDVGRIQIHNFVYGTSARANGFNYIGLTNDGAVPAASDTALTAELTTDGLQRVQGIVTLPVGPANITTVATTFTYTGVTTQGVQKTALFDSISGGVMTHEIQFTQRLLAQNATLSLTFSITLG